MSTPTPQGNRNSFLELCYSGLTTKKQYDDLRKVLASISVCERTFRVWELYFSSDASVPVNPAAITTSIHLRGFLEGGKPTRWNLICQEKQPDFQQTNRHQHRYQESPVSGNPRGFLESMGHRLTHEFVREGVTFVLASHIHVTVSQLFGMPRPDDLSTTSLLSKTEDGEETYLIEITGIIENNTVLKDKNKEIEALFQYVSTVISPYAVMLDSKAKG
eukprot:TRINITY_DN2097_c0_g2_i4.p1 TRINITY_DN2097_c0_g2~~TRINITY_DN2097_c0_g2_i4.p1  ORF type:complete len:218 (-),score=46.84 TRINITY_DN2097_c0_g2_i4:1589-2242(-)